jgi:hypothetical protein
MDLRRLRAYQIPPELLRAVCLLGGGCITESSSTGKMIDYSVCLKRLAVSWLSNPVATGSSCSRSLTRLDRTFPIGDVPRALLPRTRLRARGFLCATAEALPEATGGAFSWSACVSGAFSCSLRLTFFDRGWSLGANFHS